MGERSRALVGVLVLAAVMAAVRGPLHRVTHRLPVSNDDAIPLLIARHILKGEPSTILWNQPYNGTLDAYLLAPGLALIGHHALFRAYEGLCGGLLVVAIGLVARTLAGATAGWMAALLAAVGTPYMALMAATGPTPNFLTPLLLSSALLFALAAHGRPLPAAAFLPCGALCGLAIWNSAVALAPLSGIGLGLVLAGWRPRPFQAAMAVLGALLGLVPLAVARVIGSAAESAVMTLRPRWLWTSGLSDLARAAIGAFGLQVPLVVDGPERDSLPIALAVGLGLALIGLAAAGVRDRRALPLLGWLAGQAGAFALSRRTNGDEIRYLYAIVVPTLALAGAGAARLWTRRRALALAVLLVVVGGWWTGQRRLLAHWRDPTHADRVWEVPPIEPVLDTLRRARVESVYASLQFAARLTLESEEAVIASQAWNERIPGDPLRFRDEVDLDPRPAWVLSSRLSRGMPRGPGFRDLLATLGGRWREDLPGDFVVFRRFEPPYDEGRPVPRAALSVATLDGASLPATVLDRDVATGWTSPLGIGRGSGLVVRLLAPRRLSALVLAVDLERSPLATPWACDVDGRPVASGPARHGLQWVNGAPRAAKQALMVVPLGEQSGSEVRLIFQGNGPPLSVFEVFLYGPDEAPVAANGQPAADSALARVRAGDWDAAVRLYAEAARAEPDRAAYQACLLRARWRAARRRHLDVESLDDGGPALVLPPPRGL